MNISSHCQIWFMTSSSTIEEVKEPSQPMKHRDRGAFDSRPAKFNGSSSSRRASDSAVPDRAKLSSMRTPSSQHREENESHLRFLRRIRVLSTASRQRADQWAEANPHVLCEEHPSTLASQVNLPSMYKDQHQRTEAEQLHVTHMETRERLLGEKHPHTLTSMGSLASTYSNQGRWAEAERLLVTLLETRKRVLGEEHLHTLVTMGNLAVTYAKQGRWTEAEVLQVTVMEARKRVLGATHPATLRSIKRLARTYRKQGRLEEAQKSVATAKETEVFNEKPGAGASR